MIETSTQSSALAYWLSKAYPQQLHHIFHARPDVASPPPASSLDLAQRLLHPYSLSLILHRITNAQLQALLTPLEIPEDLSKQLSLLGLAWHTDNGWKHPPIAEYFNPRSLPLLQAHKNLTEENILVRADNIHSSIISTILDTVYLCERLLDHLKYTPAKINKNGELSTNHWRQLSKNLSTKPENIGWLIDLLVQLSLLDYIYPYENDTTYLGTTILYTRWKALDHIEKWLYLVSYWINSTHCHGFITTSTQTTHCNPLHHKLITDKQWHKYFLEAYDLIPRGYRLSNCYQGILFYRPLLAYILSDKGALLVEKIAEQLGLIENHAISSLGKALLHHDYPLCRKEARKLFPQTHKECIIDADGTITVNGPADPEMHNFLHSIANQESGGMGAMYRLDAQKIRTSLSQTMTTESLLKQLDHYSSVSIPQTIIQFLTDIINHYDDNCIGSAHSYLVTKNPLSLDEIFAQENYATYLIRIAPTVAISQLSQNQISALLTSSHINWSIINEDATTNNDDIGELPPLITSVDKRITEEVIQKIKEGDRLFNSVLNAQSQITIDGTSESIQTAIQVLRTAQLNHYGVRITLTNPNGMTSQIYGVPAAIYQGMVIFTDEGNHRRKEIALHRITSVAVLSVE